MAKIRWEDSADWDSSQSQTGVNHEPGQYLDSNPSKIQQGYQHKPLKRGLVGWWPLHTESGVANDLSGNSNDGTHNGTTRGVAGIGGLQATSFDGVDDNIIIPNQGTFDGDFTLSGWMFLTDKSSDSALATADRSTGGGSMDWALWYDTGIDEFMIYDSSTKVTSNTVIDKNQWYFLTWCHESGTSELFVNGVKQASSALSPSSSDSDDVIGTGAGGQKAMTGSIASVRIYDRALSDAEIQTLYEWGSETGLTDSRLHEGTGFGAVSRYRLNGTSSDFWSANNGSSSGITFVDDSIRGQAASFDGGTGDGIQVSHNPSLDFNPDGTVSAWFKTTDTSSDPSHRNRILIKRRDGINPRRGWYLSAGYSGGIGALFEDSSDRQLRLDNGGSGYGFYAGGNWHHVALVKNGNTGILYANGEVVTRSTNSSLGDVTNSRDLYIGQTDPSDGNHPDAFYGQIDDVRIFDQPLSKEKVQELYRWGTKGIDMTEKTVMQ